MDKNLETPISMIPISPLSQIEKKEPEYEIGNSFYKFSPDVDLGPISAENLIRLKYELEVFPMAFDSFASDISIPQTVDEFTGIVNWKFASVKEEKSYIFSLHMKKVKPIDGLEIFTKLSRNSKTIMADDLKSNYLVDVDYMAANNDWENVISNFDLSKIILSPKKREDGLTSGILHFSVNTSMLKVTFKFIPKEEPQTLNISKIPMKFEYKDDFDKNGLLYWIGTNENRDNIWTNPLDSGKIKLEISHDKMYNSVDMKKSSIITRDVIEPTYWGGSNPQWFTIDLGPDYNLCVDKFTLRHGHSAANSYICDFEFFGSLDGNNWDLLYQQIDPPFTTAFGTKTFPVKSCNHHYRYFKLLQKGNYSMGLSSGNTGGAPYLCINGLELYGEVVTDSHETPKLALSEVSLAVVSTLPSNNKTKTKSFDYSFDFDKNGILYNLATNGGKSTYKNPATSGIIKLELSHKSLYSSDMVKDNVVDHAKATSTYWGGTCPQWFSVDLGEKNLVRCSAYTLRHGFSSYNSYICNWEFQGSTDNVKWDVLHSEINPPFTKGYDTKTFMLSPQTKFYRYFRVLQKGNYSMGIGQTGGSPYLCISGFEIYGEKFTGVEQTESHIVDYNKIEKLRKQLITFNLDQKYHIKLVEKLNDDSTPFNLRNLCLDLVLDICSSNNVDIQYLIDKLDLDSFLLSAMKAPSEINEKSFQLLSVFSRNDLFKHQLFSTLLKSFQDIINIIDNIDNLNRYAGCISSLWNCDPVLSEKAYVNLLIETGKRMKKQKSNIYNILAKYQLYDFVLESGRFSPPQEKKGEKRITKKKDEIKSVQIAESMVLSALNGYEDKKRQLVTHLGTEEKAQPSLVKSLYNDCMAAQNLVYSCKKKLKKLQQYHQMVIDTSDCMMDRLSNVALVLLKQLIAVTKVSEPINYPQIILEKIFKLICVNGTPLLRDSGTKFLKNIFTQQLSFPIQSHLKYFSKSKDEEIYQKEFPQEFAFNTLRDLMDQDKHRFYYINELCLIIDKTLHESQLKGTQLDNKLITWTLMLLSNISKGVNEPAHPDSKCRGCNMMPIRGIRYRCVNCVDYDICASCEEENKANHDKDHLFVKIPYPLPLNPSSKNDNFHKEPLLPVLPKIPFGISNVHQVSCDGCGAKNFEGNRYLCLQCDEYNLCESCEKKIDHYEHHLFLKVKYPLAKPPENENPKALVPVLLHHAFYPTKSESSSVKEKIEEPSQPISLTQSAMIRRPEKGKDTGTTQPISQINHLKTAFRVLALSISSNPISHPLFFLSNDVLNTFAKQYSPVEVLNEIILHKSIDEFLRNMEKCNSLFRSTMIQTFTNLLCNKETYARENLSPLLEQEFSSVLHQARTILLEKLIKFLQSSRTKAIAPFYLELLFILASNTKTSKTKEDAPHLSKEEPEKPSTSWKTSSAPVFIKPKPTALSSEHPLDDIAKILVNNLTRFGQPNSSTAWRRWCDTLRLFSFTNLSSLINDENISTIYKIALKSTSETQDFITKDLSTFTETILKSKNISSNDLTRFYSSLFENLVESFVFSFQEGNIQLYSNLLSVMKKYFSNELVKSIKIESLAQLSFNVALYINSECRKGIYDYPQSLSPIPTLHFCELVITSSQFTDDMKVPFIAATNKLSQEKTFMSLTIDIFTHVTQDIESLSRVSSSANNDFHTISLSLFHIIESLGKTNEGAKAIIKLCSEFIKLERSSPFITDLLVENLKNESLLNYFFKDLNGHELLLSRLNSLPLSDSLESLTILENAFPYRSKGLENFSPKGKLLEPKSDFMFPSLLKTGTLYTNYLPKDEKKLQFLIEFETPIVLKEVHLSTSSHSLNTSEIESLSLEIGSTVDHLYPIGKLKTDKGSKTSYKTKLRDEESILYARLIVQCSSNATQFSLSSLRFLGYSSDPYPISPNETPESSYLPLSTVLSIFEHCLRDASVQEIMSKDHKTSHDLSLKLMSIHDDTLADKVENIVIFLTMKDDALGDFILDYILKNVTPYSSFIFKLCTSSSSQVKNQERVKKLSNYVFQSLKEKRSSLLMHNKTFITGLSLALSQLQSRKVDYHLDFSVDDVSIVYDIALSVDDGTAFQQTLIQLLAILIAEVDAGYKHLLDKHIQLDDIKKLFSEDYSKIKIIGILASMNEKTSKTFIDSGIILKLVNFLVQDIQQSMKKDITKVPIKLESGVRPRMSEILSKDIPTESESSILIDKIFNFINSVAHHKVVKEYIGENLFEKCFKILTSPNVSAKMIFGIQNLFNTCQNLCYSNQERLSQLMLDTIKNTPRNQLNQFVLQLIVDLLTLEDKIAISLIPKNRSRKELKALSSFAGSQSNPIVLDPDNTHPKLEISEEGKVLKSGPGSLIQWKTAIAKEGFSHGIHSWEVELESCTPSANIMIGVCEKNHDHNLWLGQKESSQGWSYYGATTGYIYHNGKFSSDYGKKMKSGDVIVVTLDMDAGTLSFKNQEDDFGIAYETELLGKTLYPAISLYDLTDCVRIRSLNETSGNKGIELDSSDSVFFLKPEKLFSLPLASSLDSLAKTLFLNDKEKKDDNIDFNQFIEFEYFDPNKKENVSIKDNIEEYSISDIAKVVDDGTEIIELVFNMLDDEEIETKKKLLADKEGRPKKQKKKIGTIFEIFLKNNGFHSLIATLIDQIERKINEKRAKGLKKSLRWLKALILLMKVDGFIESMIDDEDCRAIFFKIMSDAQEMPTRIVRDKHFVATQPKLSDEAVNNPLGCFFNLIVRLLTDNKGTTEDSLSIRNRVVETHVIIGVFAELIPVLDILPANPEYPFFRGFVQSYKDKKKKKEEKRKNTGTRGSDGKHWAKGTGYGTSDDDHNQVSWSHASYFKEQLIKSKKVSQILRALRAVLVVVPESEDKIVEQPELVQALYDSFLASPLIYVLESYYRNDSLLDMSKHLELYEELMNLTRAIAGHKKLHSIFGKIPGQSVLLFDLLEKLNKVASDLNVKLLSKDISKLTDKNTENISSHTYDDEDLESDEDVGLFDYEYMNNKPKSTETIKVDDSHDQYKVAENIKLTYKLVKPVWEIYSENHKDELKPEPREESQVTESEYVMQLKDFVFDEDDMTNPKTGEYIHHYKTRIQSDSTSGAKMKRLVQEIGSLSTSLPVHDSSSVFLRIDSERMDIMRVIITGPENTPYENGCFQFDIYCPSQYPKSPPLVNLQTTGNGSVRFNPNLYNCGKVCLSLLGTWRGGPNEKWSEHTSTLLQVFISIQSLIFVDEPYFNEPGYESTMGTEGGKQQSTLYNETIKIGTLRWALIDQLRNPTPGFEDLIKLHFKLKRHSIVKQCREWLKIAKKSKTPDHFTTMEKLVKELFEELQKLEPFEMEEDPENPEKPKEEVIDEDLLRRWDSISELQAFLPGMAPALYVKALELNDDQYNESINWLLDKGESYLLEHPELLDMKKPEKK